LRFHGGDVDELVGDGCGARAASLAKEPGIVNGPTRSTLRDRALVDDPIERPARQIDDDRAAPGVKSAARQQGRLHVTGVNQLPARQVDAVTSDPAHGAAVALDRAADRTLRPIQRAGEREFARTAEPRNVTQKATADDRIGVQPDRRVGSYVDHVTKAGHDVQIPVGRVAPVAADVAVNFQYCEGEAQAACREIERAGRRALAIQADVSKSAEVARLVTAVEKGLGGIDILVNNAGIGPPRTLSEITEPDWDEVLAVNLKSMFLVAQAVLPGMRRRKWGRIINLS